MHAVKGFRTYWTLNSFFFFLLKNLFNFSQRWTGVLHRYISVRDFFFFFLSFFSFFFFFFTISNSLAHEINDPLQPLQYLGGIHIWIKNNRDLDNIELLFFPLTLLSWAVSCSVKCAFIIYGLSTPKRNWMTVFSAVSRPMNYDMNIIQS